MLQKHGHILKKANFPIKIHKNNSFSRNKFKYSTDPGGCTHTIFKQFFPLLNFIFFPELYGFPYVSFELITTFNDSMTENCFVTEYILTKIEEGKFTKMTGLNFVICKIIK